MDLEVKPDDWILPNRIGYNRFVYDTFHPSKYSSSSKKMTCDCKKDECDVSSKSLKLFPQQRIIRDYMQIDSPYRGVLLYHELGSGKSAASIAAAEGYIERKDVYIFTPASLAQNYENELMKISKIGSPAFKVRTRSQLQYTLDMILVGIGLQSSRTETKRIAAFLGIAQKNLLAS